MIQSSRRGLILGLGAALVAAPAIVRAGSLMPVRAVFPANHLGFVVEAGDIYDELKSGLEVLMPKYWERYTFAYAQMPKQWQNLFGEA